jgi:long-subunit fatty acid transport protein
MTLAGASMAQDGTTVFPFLRLPHSAHATALGGENITTITDDLTLAFHNPALLSNVADKTLNLNFTSYIEGSKVASAAFRVNSASVRHGQHPCNTWIMER